MLAWLSQTSLREPLKGEFAMFAIKKFALGTLAMLSYVLMFVVIIRFFDAMSIVNSVLMVAVWLLTLALLYLADHQPGRGMTAPPAAS